ncbi:MAPEG family protein [Undibacterium danionis]|uniref:MAPEG family protein n=1 Tax=Undibacterium danionis TaxID=1812100 RepID=A0ABV6IGR2_9BURK
MPQPEILIQHPLIIPMATHVALAAFLYVLLTIARAPTIWGVGCRSDGGNPWAKFEPRISANLSNQFEWPLLFYAACLLLVQVPVISYSLVLSWIFVMGRMLHSLVQILTTNVRLRGLIFTINFLAVLGLWGTIVSRSV